MYKLSGEFGINLDKIRLAASVILLYSIPLIAAYM